MRQDISHLNDCEHRLERSRRKGRNGLFYNVYFSGAPTFSRTEATTTYFRIDHLW